MIELFHEQLGHIQTALKDAKHAYHEIDSPMDQTIRIGLRTQDELGSLVTNVGGYVKLTDDAYKHAHKAMVDIEKAGLPAVIESGVYSREQVAYASLWRAHTDIENAYPLGNNMSTDLVPTTSCLTTLRGENTVQAIAHNAHRATDQAKGIAESYGLGSELCATLSTLSERSLKLANEGFPNIVDFIADDNNGDTVLGTLSDFKDRSKRSIEATYAAALTEHLAMFITHVSIAFKEVGKDDAHYFRKLGTRLDSCLQLYQASKNEKQEIVGIIDKALEATDRTRYSF